MYRPIHAAILLFAFTLTIAVVGLTGCPRYGGEPKGPEDEPGPADGGTETGKAEQLEETEQG